MTNDPRHPDALPSPEQLAAFLDGELDPAARVRVEAWFTADASAAAEIDGQRRLACLWEATTPPEPNAAAWTATLARIEARYKRSRRRMPRTLWLGFGAAAAVLAAVLLGRFYFYPEKPAPSNPSLGREVLGVFDSEDILLASQDDVSIMNVEPFAQDDGLVATIGEGEVPMIVAPRIPHGENREP